MTDKHGQKRPLDSRVKKIDRIKRERELITIKIEQKGMT